MAVSIYNYAYDTFYPVDLTEYGFSPNAAGNYVYSTRVGGEYFFFDEGDEINITFKALLYATVTVNGTAYTKDDGEITLTGITLTAPIQMTATADKTNGFVIYDFGKRDFQAITDDAFSNLHLYFPFSPTGETLEAATADFTIHTTDADKWAKGTKIDIHDSAGIIGRFYVDTCVKTYAGQYAITASDIIGRLSDITFYGYIGHERYRDGTYTKVFSKVSDLCADIFAGYDYTVSDNCKDVEVSGYIPFGTSRDALQYVCMGCGVVVRTYRTADPIVQSADMAASHTIPETRVLDSVSVSENDAKTAVTLKPLRYIYNILLAVDRDIFQGYLPPGETLLTEGFRTYATSNLAVLPYVLSANARVTNSKYGNITRSTGVTATVSVTATEENPNIDNGNYYIRITGNTIKLYYWDKSTPEAARLENEYAEECTETYGSGEAMELSDNATTVTYHNAETVANRMIAYHSKAREANITYVMGTTEIPGDRLILPLDKTYGNISGRILSLDITPGVSKTFADAVIICDEDGDNVDNV